MYNVTKMEQSRKTYDRRKVVFWGGVFVDVAVADVKVPESATNTIVTTVPITTHSKTTTNTAAVASTSVKSFLPLAFNFIAVGSNSSGAYEQKKGSQVKWSSEL